MRAAVTPAYGPAHLLDVRHIPLPTVGPRDVLVEVRASAVTAGDLRLRSANFPSVTAIGRLFLGVFRPKHPVQGTMFAGRVVRAGAEVTRYAAGDDVFGYTSHGAYAEYLALPETAAIARMPARTTYEEAASVPYGAGTALHFLRNVANVGPGDEVLVVGAAGGVGRFAVLVAKHLGARVTGVASRHSFDLVRELGADAVVDRETEDFTTHRERYDVVFDTAGVTTFGAARAALKRHGRWLTLLFSLGALFDVVRSALTHACFSRGPRALLGVAIPSNHGMETVRTLVEGGALRPLVARSYPLEEIAEAHAAAERGGVAGSVVVVVTSPAVAA